MDNGVGARKDWAAGRPGRAAHALPHPHMQRVASRRSAARCRAAKALPTGAQPALVQSQPAEAKKNASPDSEKQKYCDFKLA